MLMEDGDDDEDPRGVQDALNVTHVHVVVIIRIRVIPMALSMVITIVNAILWMLISMPKPWLVSTGMAIMLSSNTSVPGLKDVVMKRAWMMMMMMTSMAMAHSLKHDDC